VRLPPRCSIRPSPQFSALAQTRALMSRLSAAAHEPRSGRRRLVFVKRLSTESAGSDRSSTDSAYGVARTAYRVVRLSRRPYPCGVVQVIVASIQMAVQRTPPWSLPPQRGPAPCADVLAHAWR
jgi:hypothetical protein